MRDLANRIRDHFMSAFGLPEAAASSLVASSRSSMSAGLGNLSRSLAASDAEGASHWAHSLKGNLLNSGLAEFAVLAAAIEELSMAGSLDSEEVRENLACLKAALGGFIAGG